jgi:hypothetical protein
MRVPLGALPFFYHITFLVWSSNTLSHREHHDGTRSLPLGCCVCLSHDLIHEIQINYWKNTPRDMRKVRSYWRCGCFAGKRPSHTPHPVSSRDACRQRCRKGSAFIHLLSVHISVYQQPILGSSRMTSEEIREWRRIEYRRWTCDVQEDKHRVMMNMNAHKA